MDEPRRPGLLVTDFDGTLTRNDFFRWLGRQTDDGLLIDFIAR